MRILAALAAGCTVGAAPMAYDGGRDAQRAVTPGRIADATAHGRAGIETAPRRVVTQPVPSGSVALLPVKCLPLGLGAACAVLAGTGRRIAPPPA